MNSRCAVVVGASAGGVPAFQVLLKNLDSHFVTPIIVVQHFANSSSIDFSLVFGSFSQLRICEALDKMPIEPGHVYFAAPGYHLLIERDGSLSLSQDEPVHYSRPSIDVCFESASDVYGANLCGILLTGASADGAAGLKTIASRGGFTMVQDPEQAEYPMMPSAALEAVKPNVVGSLEQLSEELKAWENRVRHD